MQANNIKKLLADNGISILKLSKIIEMGYSNAHALVNRETLDTTPLETLIVVAKALDVNVSDLYTTKQ